MLSNFCLGSQFWLAALNASLGHCPSGPFGLDSHDLYSLMDSFYSLIKWCSRISKDWSFSNNCYKMYFLWALTAYTMYTISPTPNHYKFSGCSFMLAIKSKFLIGPKSWDNAKNKKSWLVVRKCNIILDIERNKLPTTSSKHYAKIGITGIVAAPLRFDV